MKVLTLFLWMPLVLLSQTTLGAGDIALVGINCDNPDDFAFLLLKDITTGTVIKFTDDGWLSTGGFRGSEGTKIYTADSNVPAGTVIIYSASSDFTSTGSFLLSASGDQIIVYQGEANAPTLITAVNLSGNAVWQATAQDANTSALPSGLTNGANAVALQEYDNVKFTGSTSYASPAAARAAICDNSNWAGSNTTRYDFTAFGDFSLPVELGVFRGIFHGGEVRLWWVTESEMENLGFILYRAIDDGTPWKLDDFRTTPALRGQGSVTHRTEYRYTDKTILPGARYTYLLSGVDYSGEETLLRRIVVSAEAVHTIVKPSYPNPFNPRTTLEYFIPDQDVVQLSVQNLLGETIHQENRHHKAGGRYRFVWNGETDDGSPVPSGLYFLVFRSKQVKQVQKIVLTR